MALSDIILRLKLKGKYSSAKNNSANNSLYKSSSLNEIFWLFLCVKIAQGVL